MAGEAGPRPLTRGCLVLALAALIPAQQPNVPGRALMTFDLQNGPPWPIGPVPLPMGAQPTTHIAELSGTPGVPFIVAGTNALAGGGATVPGGLLDLDLSGGFAIAANGLENPAWTIGAAGAFRVAFALAAATPPGTRAFQGIVADPASPSGATLTAATSVVLSTYALNLALNLGSDTSFLLDVSPFGLSIPFYGSTYSQLFINENGSVSFSSGSSAFVSQPGAFLAAMPRIAAFWTDLQPGPGSSMSVWVVPAGPLPSYVQADWIEMREWGGMGVPHSFAIRMYPAPSGIIQILEGPANGMTVAQEILVGLSPGGNLSTAAVHPQKDLSASTAGSPVLGCPNENFHEWFGLTTSPVYTAGFNNLFDLAGRTLTFQPLFWPGGTSACGGAAGWGYLAY